MAGLLQRPRAGGKDCEMAALPPRAGRWCPGADRGGPVGSGGGRLVQRCRQGQDVEGRSLVGVSPSDLLGTPRLRHPCLGLCILLPAFVMGVKEQEQLTAILSERFVHGVGECFEGDPEPGCDPPALFQGLEGTGSGFLVVHQDLVTVDGPVGQGQCEDGLMEDELHHRRLERCIPPGGSVVPLPFWLCIGYSGHCRGSPFGWAKILSLWGLDAAPVQGAEPSSHL